MYRFTATAMGTFLLVGCQSQPSGGGGAVEQPAESLLQPGVYEGRITAVTVLAMAGDYNDRQETTDSFLEMKTIGDSGLPIGVDGEEARIGQLTSFDYDEALSGEGTITDVIVSEYWVRILSDVTLVVLDIKLTGDSQTTYTPLEGSKIQYSATITVGGTHQIDGSESFILWSMESQGVLTQVGADDASTDGFEDEEQAPGSDANVSGALEATWLVMAGDETSPLLTATAFGVSPDLLATNAHVVEGLKELFAAEPTAVAFAVHHETGEYRQIVTVLRHPDYDPDSLITTPDVGVLKVDEALPDFLSLPGEDVLHELTLLQSVSLCGFPADVVFGIDFAGLITGEFYPRATCLTGTISSLRPFDPGVSATAENSKLLQYDLPVAPGTSGSAVFDDGGQVIGINAGGFSGDGEFNFAIRSDSLKELLAWMEQEALSETVLDEIPSAPPEFPPTEPPQTDPLPCVTYPCPIIEPGPFCDLLCIQYSVGGTIFCDSDCDGWYDAVEHEFWTDPCNPFDPPFAPDPGIEATVCAKLSLLANKAIPIDDNTRYRVLEQQRIQLRGW